MKNIYILAVAALVLSLGSCTIEKRHYQSGYHVEWNHRNKAIDKAEEVKIAEPAQEATAAVETPATEEIAPVVKQQVMPAKEIQPAEETTATLRDEPVFTKKSVSQQLTERAESNNNQVRSNESQDENQMQLNEQQNAKNGSNEVSDILLIILCIFIPFLAVYLYESDITTNFWVDLLLTLLFWVPGMIFAFLVCFAGVSL